jgi:hypothetical protein
MPFPARIDRPLLRGEEPRAHRHTVGTEGQHGREPLSQGYPTCYDGRPGGDVDDLSHEGDRADETAVSARLTALYQDIPRGSRPRSDPPRSVPGRAWLRRRDPVAASLEAKSLVATGCQGPQLVRAWRSSTRRPVDGRCGSGLRLDLGLQDAYGEMRVQHGVPGRLTQARISLGRCLCAVPSLFQLDDGIAGGALSIGQAVRLVGLGVELPHDGDEYDGCSVVGLGCTQRLGRLLLDAAELAHHIDHEISPLLQDVAGTDVMIGPEYHR